VKKEVARERGIKRRGNLKVMVNFIELNNRNPYIILGSC
jgi:hypothetical protein